MKLSYSWLKDYLKCELSPAQIAEAMTSIGIEVDGVEEQEKIPGGLAGVVVAEVLECEDHPNSDHLHITKVNDGTGEPLTVVCGAPNVAAGQKVLFARVGAVLPGDFKIKKSKIRGVESFGMICAEDELGLGAGHDGIMVLPEDAVVGTPAKEYLHLETEAVIEYEITANRVDAASHWGVARDLYAYLKLRGIPCELVRPSVDAFREADADGGLDVEVLDADGAPRYTGITIRGVKTAPSPQWMQDRLTAIGLRPIDNIVDISNYILFELGQPLHTFDADKVKGGKVIVRRATEGEVIRTLDGVERKLSSRDMVIADDDFSTIVGAVREGRRIFSNIRKTITFFLATNAAEVLTVLLASLALIGFDFLRPTQLLWINLITDSLPVLALGCERADDYAMSRPPERAEKALFARGTIASVLFFGLYMTVICIGIFVIALNIWGNEVASTMTFLTISFLELFHAFNIRSERASAFRGFFTNKILLGTVFAGVAINVLLVMVPPVASAFGLIALNGVQWGIVAALSLSVVLVGEIYKAFLRFFSARKRVQKKPRGRFFMVRLAGKAK